MRSATSGCRASRSAPATRTSPTPLSEQVLIEQRDEFGNHNGGDLHFGADGYLYVSLGDEGNGNDTHRQRQNITRDFFSAIMRIDVDKKAGTWPPTPTPR